MSDVGLGATILDMRCLQDPGYARRGIGRHVMALLRRAPRNTGLCLVGLVDPTMPPLLAEAAALLDSIAPNAYAAERAIETAAHRAFVSLSPMTHSPEYAARLLSNPNLLRSAIVYDFIPRRFPNLYLPTETDKLNYALAIRWLARCDVFASISHSSAIDLRAELGTPKERIVVTGCSIAPIFSRERNGSSEPKHVFVSGGSDRRKNPEVVIRAHARSELMQRRGFTLRIGGNYSAREAQEFRALAAEIGGKPDLIDVPGHVTDAELNQMYHDALVVVSPSRDEGFSLPVIEGMTCGTLCAASDIPAHRELISDPALRFAVEDDAAVARILERAAQDSDWRTKVIARQDTIWPRFREEEVASRFWGMLGQPSRRPSTPAVARSHRPRVAMLAPLPPDRSGVADYTAASCADLGRLVDLHLFTETTSPLPRAGVTSIRPLSALPHVMPSFDRVISVLGNSHFHKSIFDLHQRYGGACIAHDARMLGFYRMLLGTDRALAEASRELGREVGEAELNVWLGDEGKLEALFLGEIAAASSPMIVHSPATVDLCTAKYGITPAYVPFNIYRPWRPDELSSAARREARARMGVTEKDVVIVSFGFVNRSKAPEECVWALNILRRWNIPARLHFVGDMAMADASLSSLIDRLGLSAHVRIWKGYVSEQDYRDHLVGSDLGIQLRTYGHGGLSGALLDCAAAGLPTVANEALVHSVGVPRGYTRSIPDALSPLLLAEALADLLDAVGAAGAPARREQERSAFSRERSFSAYAQKLCQVLELDLSYGNFSERSAA